MVREQDVSPVKRCRQCGKTKPRKAFGLIAVIAMVSDS